MLSGLAVLLSLHHITAYYHYRDIPSVNQFPHIINPRYRNAHTGYYVYTNTNFPVPTIEEKQPTCIVINHNVTLEVHVKLFCSDVMNRNRKVTEKVVL